MKGLYVLKACMGRLFNLCNRYKNLYEVEGVCHLRRTTLCNTRACGGKYRSLGKGFYRG